MLKVLLCAVITLAAVHASGNFVVLHSPGSVLFRGNKEVEQSLLKEVIAAVLGFTVKMREVWDGISILVPFRLPEAVVFMAIEGVQSLKIPQTTAFSLSVDENEETTWQAIRSRIEERSSENTLIRISLSDGLDALGQSSLGELITAPIEESSLTSLTLAREEDRKFLEEVQLLRAIAKKVPSAIRRDSKPDVYWLVVSGLRPVFDAHGMNSSAAREALSLLRDAFNAVSEAFIEAYDGQVIVAAFTNDASQVRHARSAVLERQLRDTNNEQDDGQDENKNVGDEEDTNINIDSTSESSDMSTTTTYSDFRDENSEGTEKSDQDLTSTENNINSNTKKIGQKEPNLSEDYSADYPVIFNIFLWFGIIFAFSLLAICIAIADMDPGRDSIIYRMTSNRMKKDN